MTNNRVHEETAANNGRRRRRRTRFRASSNCAPLFGSVRAQFELAQGCRSGNRAGLFKIRSRRTLSVISILLLLFDISVFLEGIKMSWKTPELVEGFRRPILVVGAGGIGCELLKNLVLTGFTKIHVIDLDTIDISNLNRQFLFRREHVGKSKAEVASAAVKMLKPSIDISFDHGSITDKDKYDVAFFKKFYIVFNALDNKAARAHVNRLCLSAEVPLFESGSAGYLGNAMVILKGRTECYECQDKPITKTFPGCTIRNTPSELIHCVVWAKAVFNQLFGEEDPDDAVSPEIAEGNSENGSAEALRGPSVRAIASSSGYEPKAIFDKLFDVDIQYLLSMDSLWKDRKPPVPRKWDNYSAAGTEEKKDKDRTVWPIQTWVAFLTQAVKELGELFKKAQQENNVLTWDKDDRAAMEFVAAAANVRAEIFHIETKSFFDIKSMAGNIIPAIATTNAMVAGMVVNEAIRFIRKGDKADLRSIYCNPHLIGKKLISSSLAPPPQKSCFVCGANDVIVTVNVDAMKVSMFEQHVLKNGLLVVAPDVMDVETNKIIISSEDDVDTSVTLKDRGLGDGSRIDVDDFSQDFNFKIQILHDGALEPEQFKIEKASQKSADESVEAEAMEIVAVPEPSRKRPASTNENLVDGEIVELKRSRNS